MTEPLRAERTTVDGAHIEWLDVPERARLLDLAPHPEGGWYRRTWTGGTPVDTAGGVRPAATLIHFLLPVGEQSLWHKVVSDEIWLWHGPGTLTLELGGTGEHPVVAESIRLGPDLEAGQVLQLLVPAGVWQRTLPAAEETLVSCVVSPGFSFEDWQLEK